MTEDLLAPSTKDKLQALAAQAVQFNDRKAAQKILLIMEENMPLQAGQVSQDEDLYNIYKHFWHIAQFITLPALPEEDYIELLTDSLGEGLDIPDYNIIEEIGKRIGLEFLEEEQVKLMEQTLPIIEKNQALIGSNPIVRNGASISQTVANWIQEYLSYPTRQALHSNIDEISYISKSPNASKLSPEDKDKLLDVIELYDSLKNWLAKYNAMPKKDSSELTEADIARMYKGVINLEDPEFKQGFSGNTVSTPPPVSAASPSPVPKTPVYSAPQVAPTRAASPTPAPVASRPPRETSIITEDKLPAELSNKNSVTEEVKQALEESKFKIPSRPLNVQDFLNERHNKGGSRGGIVFDNPPKPVGGNMNVPAAPAFASSTPISKPPTPPANLPMAAAPREAKPAPPAPAPQPTTSANPAADDIAKKLAELRKRKQP